MEFVLGQVERELRCGEEWWIVSYRGAELMTFETLALAHEWRRSTPLYVHYEPAVGVQYYMQEANEWYVRAAGSRGWRKVAEQRWVERAVQQMQAAYRKRMAALGARAGGLS